MCQSVDEYSVCHSVDIDIMRHSVDSYSMCHSVDIDSMCG